MRKQKKQILVLTMISVFMATVLFLPRPTDAGGKKHKQIMTALDEIYDIVSDTNSKVTPAPCNGAPVSKTGQTTIYVTGDDGDLYPTVARRDGDRGETHVADRPILAELRQHGIVFENQVKELG